MFVDNDAGDEIDPEPDMICQPSNVMYDCFEKVKGPEDPFRQIVDGTDMDCAYPANESKDIKIINLILSFSIIESFDDYLLGTTRVLL
jgi:hypothetical protein